MVRGSVLFAVLALAFAGCGGGGDDDGDPLAAPAAGTAVVWVVGDAADAGSDARAVARTVTQGRLDRLVYLGDVYERGTLREFRRKYDPLYGGVATRTWPILGNHEYFFRKVGFDVYWRRRVGQTPPRWYRRRLGGWELLMLSSESPHSARSRQVRWLRARIAEAPESRCRIAFTHAPRYNAGSQHGDDPELTPVWNALRGHAAATVSGHEHSLQRLKPVDGLVPLIAGAGGRELDQLTEDDRLAFGDDTHYGALRLELREGRAAYTFVAAGGRVLDRGELRC